MTKALISHFLKLRWLQNAKPDEIFNMIGVEMIEPSMECFKDLNLSPIQLRLIDNAFGVYRSARQRKKNYIGSYQSQD